MNLALWMTMNKILQIYYDVNQAPELDFEGFFNPLMQGSTEHYLAFESTCMVHAILEGLHNNTDLFGMVSWKFKEKLRTSKRWPGLIRNTSDMRFAADKFFEHAKGFDVCSMTNHPPHSVYGYAEQFHPGICQLTQDILDECRFGVNAKHWSEHGVIYFNYFVAKSDIYSDFALNWMMPFIRVALSDKFKERSLANSCYPSQLPANLQKHFNINHYPMLPFMTERLINLYLIKNKLSFSNF